MEYIGKIEHDIFLQENTEREIVIFGCGNFGKYVLEYIEGSFIKTGAVFFCDNNERYVGKKIRHREVLSVQDAVIEHEKATFLIKGQYANEMAIQLSSQGITGIHFYL